jgi:hypothetical protein
MVTRLTQLWGKRTSFANTLFYSNPDCFTDIVLGDNRATTATNGYTTTAGWDAATGLGSPKGDKIYQLLHTGATYPRSNYGFKPTSGPSYPRKRAQHHSSQFHANTWRWTRWWSAGLSAGAAGGFGSVDV